MMMEIQREKRRSFILSFCLSGFPPESELKSEVGARDQDPPSSSSSSMSSASLGLTQPIEPPSPIISVSGLGSSTVTTATTEQPPTLLPASSKPQVTQEGWGAMIKGCLLSLRGMGGWGGGGYWGTRPPLPLSFCHKPLILSQKSLTAVNLLQPR